MISAVRLIDGFSSNSAVW